MILIVQKEEVLHLVIELVLEVLVLNIDGLLKDMTQHLSKCEFALVLMYLLVFVAGRMRLHAYLSILGGSIPELGGRHICVLGFSFVQGEKQILIPIPTL